MDRELSPAELDKALHDHLKNVVVIYGENHNFNNLFANSPGVEHPLSSLQPADFQQRDLDGGVLDALPQVWGA